MTKHPLTLAQIKKLARRYTCDMESGEYSFGEDTVRAAADWQLEQCIAWLNDTDCDDPRETAQRFREAMRPHVGTPMAWVTVDQESISPVLPA
jgi:hypothetical protein